MRACSAPSDNPLSYRRWRPTGDLGISLVCLPGHSLSITKTPARPSRGHTRYPVHSRRTLINLRILQPPAAPVGRINPQAEPACLPHLQRLSLSPLGVSRGLKMTCEATAVVFLSPVDHNSTMLPCTHHRPAGLITSHLVGLFSLMNASNSHITVEPNHVAYVTNS